MAANDSNYTSGEESWLMYIWENYLAFMPFKLGLLVTLLILYCPVIFGLALFYAGNLFLYIYQKIGKLSDDPDSVDWKKPQYIHAYTVHMLAKILHGYEICGMDKIPEGPAVLVFYHGSLPCDIYFFTAAFLSTTGRICRSVVDRFLFHLPGLKTFLEKGGCATSNREECVALLKKGHLLIIAPGGLREQNYGDNNYKLIWRNRQGFAHIATSAKVPVIPVFTQNGREGYRVYGNVGLMRRIYERTRLVVFPVLGPFPVKMRTYIGEPIPYDPNITTEELFEKVKLALEALIEKHQKIPGSILSALWERFQFQNTLFPNVAYLHIPRLGRCDTLMTWCSAPA